MKTRRNGKKTKGGKTQKENYDNYKSVWTNTGHYDPKINYPSRFESLWSSPTPTQELREGKEKNTYIFKRHGFSCANMLKDKKTVQQYMIPDPSLCSYGILSLLRKKTKPEGFDGIVFVSSLVRTWQTAMLEYGSFQSLTLIVSPYIKEKDSHSFDSPNFPLPFPRQLAKMEQFMKLLTRINSPVAKQILSHKHTIVKDGESKTFGPYPHLFSYVVHSDPRIASENAYLTTLKHANDFVGYVPEKEVEAYVFIPSPKDMPDPDYSKYYKAEGFLYFDAWIGKHYPSIKTVFVVSHSKFMQKIIKQFSAKTIDTDIFKQNVWTLRISPKDAKDPKHLKMNYKIQIYPGIPKPHPNLLEYMDRQYEALCNDVNEPDITPEPLPGPDTSSHSTSSTHQPLGPDLSSHSTSSTHKPLGPDLSSHSTSSTHQPLGPDASSHSTNSSYQRAHSEQIDLPRSRFESDASDVSQLSFLTEETPFFKIKTTPVTNEKKDVILTRSFSELIHMLRDPSIAHDLSELIKSQTDFKTKAIQFVYSNPTVQIADPTQPKSFFKKSNKVPIRLFENHYLAFLLMDNSYFESIVQRLESSNPHIIDAALSYFNIRASSASIIAFLKSLRHLIDEDVEFYSLLVQKFSENANKHYYLKAVPYYFEFTLLDLLLYEFTPTTENIRSVYRFIIDLVKNGARFSTTIYSRDDAVKDWIQFPSSEIIPLSMPSVGLETIGTEQKEHEITVQWEDAKRRLDPHNELSPLNKQYRILKRRLNDEHDKLQTFYDKAYQQPDELSRIHDEFMEKNRSLVDQLEAIKKKHREATSRIDPKNEFLELRLAMRKTVNTGIYNYLNMHLADLIDSEELKREHNAMLKPFIEEPKRTEPIVSIGGLKGTSWKKSSLRRSSVKAGRYRVSQYKGKRRTRANRS